MTKFVNYVAFLILVPIGPTAAQTPQTKPQVARGVAESQAFRLSPEAAQVAEQIGVAQLLKELSQKSSSGSEITLESLVSRAVFKWS